MSRLPILTLEKVRTRGLLTRREAHRVAKMLFYDPSRVPKEVIDRTYNEVNTPKKMRACLQALKVAKDYDVSTLLPNIRCPLLMVWGDHDKVTPLADWLPHLTKLKQCQVLEIEKCGHSPMVEKPDDFNKVVLAFLHQHLPGAQPEPLLVTP
jgi:pimeloyl-ACP methyl ester carboxylesterase